MFTERDYVGLAGSFVDLTCIRMEEEARVIWETVDIDGEQVTLIYDSQVGTTPSDGYDLINVGGDSNDFTLQITMSQSTAMLTRCSISYNIMSELSATSMLFMIGNTQLDIMSFIIHVLGYILQSNLQSNDNITAVPGHSSVRYES